MSLQEVLKQEIGKVKYINVDTCKIYGDMKDDLDAINKKYFNDNLPSGFGNMSYSGGSTLIGQHYKTAGINGVNAEKSSIVEDNKKFDFGDKDFELVHNINANKYIKIGGTSTELLKANGDTVEISNLPDGNIKYTAISGNIGSHYQQSSLDGKSCIESNLSEDVSSFYFGTRDLTDIKNINCVDVSTTGGIYTNNGFENSLLDADKLLFTRASNTAKISYSGLEIKNDTGTTRYENQNISDDYVININSTAVIASGNMTANSYKIPFGTNQYVLLADGTTALYNAGGGQGNYYLYQNDTDITVPPSTAGHIQYDNTVQQNAGVVWINHLTQDAVDIDYFLSSILTNDIIYLQDKENSTNWIKYTINSKTQILNAYTTLTVSFLDGEGKGLTTFGNNHPIFFTIFINQNLINQRLDALETRTRYQSSNTSNQTTFTNTLNTDIINANHIYKIGDGEYITNTEADAVYLKIVNEANPSPITLTNSGITGGYSLLNSTTNPNFSTKSLSIGSGLSITDSSNNITIINTSQASSITLGNAGLTGASLVASTSSNPAFLLKSLSSSTGIILNNSGSTVEIVNSSPASSISISDTGSGETLINSSTNPNFSFKKLISGSGVSLSSTADNITITSTSASSINLSNGGANLSLVASSSSNPNLQNKSVSAGAGININDVKDNLEFVNSSPASSISISSSGVATSLWKTLSNPSFVSKDLISSTGISISNTSDTVIFSNSLPSTDITLSDAGLTGASLVAISSVNPHLKVKSLIAGSNITLTDISDTITINSTGGGGGSYTFSNAGSGTTLVSTTSGINDFKTVSITAGANVAISNSGTDIVISASGSSGTNTINVTSIPSSASTYYPLFSSVISGNLSTISTDGVGLSYIPSDNKIIVGAVNSGIFTSNITPPSIGFQGHALSASQIQTTGNPSSASTFYPTFVATSTSATSEVLNKDVGLSYRPSDNKLMASVFEGTTFTGTGLISTISFVGTATNAGQISTTASPTSTSLFYPTFVATSATNNNEAVYKDVGFSYRPSDNSIFCDNVNAITFTSSTAIASAGFVGTSSQALKLAQTSVTASASIYYPVFSPSSLTSTAEAMAVESTLFYQPSTNTLSAGTFSGPLSGNATTASNFGLVGTNNLLIQTGTNTTALLGNGTAGQFLQSNGTSLPTWVTNSTAGFQMSFGGRSTVVGDYLQPNRYADATATTLTVSNYQTQWLCPASCTIIAWSSSVQTTGTSAIAVIYFGGAPQNSLAGFGTNTTNTGTLSRAITAGQILEVRINSAVVGGCCLTLYFT